MEHVVVFITCANSDEGKKISQALVEEKLAACVTMLPEVSSTYWWEGKIETSAEVMLMAKTKGTLVKRVVDRVKKLHSYEVPETIALSISGGNNDYLQWIDESLKIVH